jgi:integrase
MASIFKRGNKLSISYYVPGKKSPVVHATGIEWLDEAPPTKEWVRTSRDPKAKRLKLLLTSFEAERETLRFKRKHPELIQQEEREQAKNYTFAELLDAYIAYKTERRSPLAPNSLRVYRSSVKHLQSYRANATLKDLTEEFAESYERFLHSDTIELSTARAYLRCLRGLCSFARKKKWLESDPLGLISVKAPVKYVSHDNLNDEIEWLRWAWNTDAEYTSHHLYGRITGFRVSDGILLKKSDVDFGRGVIHGWNQKLKRPEPWPLHKALALLLPLIWELPSGPRKDFVLPLLHYQTLSDRQEKLHAVRPFGKPGFHNWKRNYVRDIQQTRPPEEVYKHLKHHAPDDVARRYEGTPLDLMKEYSDRALAPFIALLEELNNYKTTTSPVKPPKFKRIRRF